MLAKRTAPGTQVDSRQKLRDEMPSKQKEAVKNSRSPPHMSPDKKMHFDLDDPDYIRDLQRPAVIKEDLNEMERRKRVQQILESKAFREELEQLILSEKNQGSGVDRLKTLEQLSQLILPSSPARHPSIGAVRSVVILPIADLRGAEVSKFTKQERILRNKLASLYRLIDLFQWSQGIYNHNSVRMTTEGGDVVLTNPFGLLYHEITASSLVKVNFTGQILDPGSSGLGINDAAYVLHTAIYQARSDIRCIIHMHTPVVGAVAAMKCGFLPISQEALAVGTVSYHEYQGAANEDEQRSAVACDIGNSKVMFLRNHGYVACGSTIAEAFHLAYNVVLACETQIRAVRAGIDNLFLASEEAKSRAAETAKEGAGGGSPNRVQDGVKKIQWGVGELEWEAWMRVLDSAGYRTGHVYRQPWLSSKAPLAHSDVAQPPAATARGLLTESDHPPEGQILHGKNEGVWMNSPNAYTKLLLKETGTSEPKTYTKWVQDINVTGSTPVKIVPPHQFVPVAPTTREFKEKRNMLKEARRVDTISAGPQSKVLDPVAWQDIEKIKEADMTGSEDKVMIGAASKGIIEREFRHNAQIYQQLYQPNPFSSETDEDIKAYLKAVEKKHDLLLDSSGERHDESPSPESISLMLAARDQQSPAFQDETPTSTGSGLVTTFDAMSDRATTLVFGSPKLISDISASPGRGSWFQRSKSERFHRILARDANTAGDDGKALSDDELQADGKKDKKKKMFKTPAFLSRGKKDRKKKEVVTLELSE
uniref:Class II aldolase/adducin N-terminal domain-containing protein n=1 Tax=Trichuris muris TaxID=70415 RepID=A0A5S6QGI3_TRIMR